MKVGIVGAGLQAKRRGPVVNQFPDCEVSSITSLNPETAKSLANDLNCKVVDNWKEVINDNIDAVIICTYPDSHAEISIAAMKNGIHVLCEKPLARTENECKEMINAAKDNNVILKCGFNHRYHPAISMAKKWQDDGKLGKINFIRCRYGICGREGLEKEWRSDRPRKDLQPGRQEPTHRSQSGDRDSRHDGLQPYGRAGHGRVGLARRQERRPEKAGRCPPRGAADA